MKAEHINPFVLAASNVFSTMLKCDLKRGKIVLHENFQPMHEVSGVIGLSGKMVGTVVFNLEREVAISAAGVLLGEKPDDLNEDVVDAVGELTNMIAGQAKAKLEQYEMSLALPTVISGMKHTISFGDIVNTIGIPFSCDWGHLTVEVGLTESESLVSVNA